MKTNVLDKGPEAFAVYAMSKRTAGKSTQPAQKIDAAE
jgi:hypothetical protein